MGDAPYGLINVLYDSEDGSFKVVPPRKSMDKKAVIELFLVACIIGFAVLGFDYCTDLYVKLITKTPLMKYYETSEAMYNIVQTFFSLFAIMIPFGLALPLIKLVQRNTVILPLWKPNSKKVFFAALGVAFLTLLISNVIVSMGTIFGEAVGFEFEAAESPAPQSFSGYLWQVLSVAIVPAFVEEYAVRGIMLQSLRKYGDFFAMLVSSIFFGLMHGNCLQAPFAFILGMVMCWLVIKTDSLWTGIAIHFMNNFYATTLLALGEICSTGVYVALVAGINILGALLGIVAIIWFIDKKEINLELKKVYKWEPYLVAICSVPMIVAIIRLIKTCLETVSYVGFD